MRGWLCAALLGVATVAGWALPGWPATGADSDAVRAALSGLSANDIAAAARRRNIEAGRTQLAQLYGRRAYALLWSHGPGPTPEALRLIHLLAAADAQGLVPDDYQPEALARAIQSLQQAASTPDQWAQFDLRLSMAALAFITDLHRGRIDPRAAGFELPVDLSGFDATTILEQLAARGDAAGILEQIEPQFIHYRLLEQALPRFRQLSLEPDLTHLAPLPAAKLLAGEHYAGAPALRRLLTALRCLPAPHLTRSKRPTGSATSAADPLVLDGQLVGALKCFQALNGLQVDGALGRATYAALTLPLAQRVRQIELTLERWRWLPPLQFPSIIVNIPQFRLFALRSERDREDEMLRMDVIVGREYPRSRTPVFAADMKYVVFRPYWDVPRSILVHEILPLLAGNPRYLDSQDMEIVRGESDEATVLPPTPENIQALAAGQLRLRQRPGANNALGLIKFMLPNEHNVYLHSTPAPRLFGQARRTFSHGCIRVSDPVALAEQVLRGTAGNWTHESIVADMNGSTTLHVPLAAPVHVLILYGTAVATEDGAVHFFDDIYGYDRRLESLLGLAPYQNLTRPVSTWTKSDSG
jgi:murein L,D-transpeptidase YcbB/YkuD